MMEFWNDYIALMQEPAHLAVEFTFVAFDYAVIQVVVRTIIKRRDRKHKHDH